MIEPSSELVETLFAAALDLPEAERSAYVQRASAGDTQLCQRVARLLAAHESAAQMLPTPPPGGTGHDMSDLAGPDPLLGTTLGPFRIIQRLGEGGMGVVYEAEQERPSRRVAVKVLGLGLVTREAWKRFDAEIRTQGSLDHPAIVPVHEAGIAATSRGSVPYFAMPLVRGQTIDAYIRATDPRTQERIDLLARVCDGVGHAHARGIIHRDLKPANILVEVDESGVTRPRILDFGVAKALSTDAGGLGNTLAGQIVGTPQYMSPEQAAGDTGLVTTCADVYALGVIAYEVLSGQRPYEVGRSSVTAAARIILEIEPPRLGTLGPNLRGDIETVVAKAMAKDPARRYQSASEFAADLRRVARGEPVLAQSPSFTYVLRRFIGRHRATSAAIGAGVLALAIGIAAAAWQARRATLSAREALGLASLAESREYLAQIGAAKASFDSGDVAEARRRLALAPEQHRGWEWWVLWRALDESQRTIYPGRTAPTSLALDGDDRRVVFAEGHAAIGIVDLATGRVVGRWQPEEPVEASAPQWRFQCSPEGAVCVHIPGETRVAVLATADASLLGWAHFPFPPTRCGFIGGPDQTLWACDLEGRVAVSSPNGETGQPLSTIGRPIAWGVTGSAVVTRESDGSVLLRRLPDASVIAELPPNAPTEGWVMSRGGSAAAAIDADRALFVIDGVKGSVRRVGVPPTAARVLAIRDDGSLAACVDKRSMLMLVAIPSKGPPREVPLVGHRGGTIDAQFTADGRTLWATGSHVLKSWSAEVFFSEGRPVLGRFDDQGQLVTITDAGELVTLDPHTGLGTAPGRAMPVLSRGARDWDISLQHDCLLVISAANPSLLACQSIATGGERWSVTHDRPLSWVRISPDGSHVLARDNSPRAPLLVLDARTGNTVRILPGSDEVGDRGLALDPSGSEYAGIESTDVVFRSLLDGRETGRFRTSSVNVSAISIDAIGGRVAAGSQDGVLRIWSRADGQLRLEIRIDAGFLSMVQLRPGGTRVLVEGTSGMFRLLDTADGREVISFNKIAWATRPTFSPDGITLMGVSDEGAVIRWSAGSAAERAARVALLEAIIPSAAAARLRADAALPHETRSQALDWLNANPPDPETLNAQAWLIACCPGDTPESYAHAVKLAQAAVEVSPNAGFALNTLGAALLRAGQPSGALTVLAKAAEINENFPVDDSLMAMAHAALGQSAQARAALQRAETISLSAWNVGISRAILEEARFAVNQDREQKANDAP